MPELPDVEQARKLLHERCVGRKLTQVRAASDSIVFAGATDLESRLRGRKMVGSGRRGKQFWLEFSKQLVLFVHFGMTGQVHVKGESASHYRKIEVDVGADWPPQYTKLELQFGQLQVAFTDPRRLGRIRLYEGVASESPIVSKLGFDPVIDPPSPQAFAEMVMRRKMPVKALLLKQEFSAGVGNWIADEVLFRSSIHPAQLASTLTQVQTNELLRQLKDVCGTAVAANADSRLFPKEWLFHYRWAKGRKQPAQMPDGRAIEFVTVGGRTTAIVPAVQQLPEVGQPSLPKKKRKVYKE